VLYVIQKVWVPFEDVQLWVALATLPFALLFIVAYIPERPWGQWFGASLLLLAVGVLAYTLTVVLFRFYGPDYWGRDVMVTTSVGLVLTAMSMRTWVLLSAQARDRRGPGWFLARHSSRIYHSFVGR
jgi:hypothetical protein